MVRDTRAKAWVRAEEAVHTIAIAGEYDHEIVTLVPHHLHARPAYAKFVIGPTSVQITYIDAQ